MGGKIDGTGGNCRYVQSGESLSITAIFGPGEGKVETVEQLITLKYEPSTDSLTMSIEGKPVMLRRADKVK